MPQPVLDICLQVAGVPGQHKTGDVAPLHETIVVADDMWVWVFGKHLHGLGLLQRALSQRVQVVVFLVDVVHGQCRPFDVHIVGRISGARVSGGPGEVGYSGKITSSGTGLSADVTCWGVMSVL